MVAKLDLSDFSKEEIKDTLEEVRHPVSVAIYSSENYFNAGAIIRLGHCHLVQEIFLIDMGELSKPYYKKACMGTAKYENLTKTSLEEFIEGTKDRNIVTFERRPTLTTENLYYFEWPENPIIFLGSEKFGVPDEIIERANNLVSIPCYGLTHDLNIFSAASIAIYDWVQKHYRMKQNV